MRRCRACPRLAALLLLLVVLYACDERDGGGGVCRGVRATVVSSSQIEYCTNTGDEPVNCSRKMIVTLSVDGGQGAGTEEIVYVKTATDTTARYKDENNATSANVTLDVEFEPIRLTVSRSVVRYRYPLYYERNFNAQPREEVIAGTLLRQCNAAQDETTATCGLQFDQSGGAIPYSQGFCCDCNMCEVLGVCKVGSRMADRCSPLHEYTAAFCLRFDAIWYAGYSIGPHTTAYTLDVHVAANATPQNASVLHLSPDAPGDTAPLFGVVARLLGDLEPTVQPRVLESSMLFVPALPRDSERVAAGVREFLLLARSLVTIDGRECNKVGVSYEAFASQGNACKMSSGSCLQAQLESYRDADVSAMQRGQRGAYFATAIDNFDLQQYVAEGKTKAAPYLTYIAASPPAALVTLTLNADKLRYVVAVAKGRIVSALMTRKEVAVNTRDGMLLVEVENTGSITASFGVSVVNCTTGVFPIPAQKVTLVPLQRSQLRFDVTVQSVADDGKAVCTVVLRNALEAVLDTSVVMWQVVAVNATKGAQGDASASGAYGGGVIAGRDRSACSTCSAISLNCAFGQRCPHAMATQLGTLLVVLLILLLLFVCRARLRDYCCCCCWLCCGSRRRRLRPARASPREYGGGGVYASHEPVVAMAVPVSEPFACPYEPHHVSAAAATAAVCAVGSGSTGSGDGYYSMRHDTDAGLHYYDGDKRGSSSGGGGSDGSPSARGVHATRSASHKHRD